MTVKNIKNRLKELKEKQDQEKKTSPPVAVKKPKPVKEKKPASIRSTLPSPKQLQNQLNQKIHGANPPSLFRLPIGTEFTLKYQEDLTWLGVLKVPGEDQPYTMVCVSGEWALRILGKQWYLKQKEKTNGK